MDFDWERAAAIAVARQAYVIMNEYGDRAGRAVAAAALRAAEDRATPEESAAGNSVSLAFGYF